MKVKITQRTVVLYEPDNYYAGKAAQIACEAHGVVVGQGAIRHFKEEEPSSYYDTQLVKRHHTEHIAHGASVLIPWHEVKRVESSEVEVEGEAV